MRQRHQFTPDDTPSWIVESTALSHALIDYGLRAGLDALRHTPGLAVDPWAQHDVLALALRRALTAGLPVSATVDDVLARLTAMQEAAHD